MRTHGNTFKIGRSTKEFIVNYKSMIKYLLECGTLHSLHRLVPSPIELHDLLHTRLSS